MGPCQCVRMYEVRRNVGSVLVVHGLHGGGYMLGDVVCFSLSLSPAALLLVSIRRPSGCADVCIYAHIYSILKRASMDETLIVAL